YPLPPGLGAFPLRHLDDHAARLPEDWRRRGGVIMPMYQAEAMWLHFGGGRGWGGYPFAVKIGTGKINAVSGEGWSSGLNRDPQDYVAVPRQPWLDGYCVEKGVIRQFVAMKLGEGWSVEEQLTGAAEWGGVQIVVYPMKAERYEALVRARRDEAMFMRRIKFSVRQDSFAMGLAPGGRMKQEIYDDPYELADYDQRRGSRCFVTILNSAAWRAVAGERPPMQLPTAKDYAKAGLPWFDYYDADAKALGGAEPFGQVKSLGWLAKLKGGLPADIGEPVAADNVVKLGPSRTAQVREAEL
ncbi:MAG: hypothetical protein ACKVP5_22320, partial [Aestuariivirga sp.]